MITRVVKVKIKTEYVNEFRAYIRIFLCNATKFTNNHHADCFEDLEENNHFHIYTIWKTEGALSKFRKSDINIEFKNMLIKWGKKQYSAWTIENIKEDD